MLDEKSSDITFVDKANTIQPKAAVASKKKGKHIPGLPKKSSTAESDAISVETSPKKSLSKKKVSAGAESTNKTFENNSNIKISSQKSAQGSKLENQESARQKNLNKSSSDADADASESETSLVESKDSSSDSDVENEKFSPSTSARTTPVSISTKTKSKKDDSSLQHDVRNEEILNESNLNSNQALPLGQSKHVVDLKQADFGSTVKKNSKQSFEIVEKSLETTVI